MTKLTIEEAKAELHRRIFQGQAIEDAYRNADQFIDELHVSWAEKHFILPLDKTERSDGYLQQYAIAADGYWHVIEVVADAIEQNKGRIPSFLEVTQKDIDDAPEWVRALTPIEVDK